MQPELHDPAEYVSPEILIGRHVDEARAQLSDARERLKAARRRVTQLEEVVVGWEDLAATLRRHPGSAPHAVVDGSSQGAGPPPWCGEGDL